MHITRALALISLISLVPSTWSLGADDAQAMPAVEAIEPGTRVLAEEGKPIRVRWRVLRRPAKPQDWIVDVALDGCVFGSSRISIYSAPLEEAASMVDWIPTREFLENLSCDGDCEEVPILVRLINRQEDYQEMYAYHSTCKCVPTSGWLVCARPAGFVDLEAAVTKAREEAGRQ